MAYTLVYVNFFLYLCSRFCVRECVARVHVRFKKKKKYKIQNNGRTREV